MAAHRPDDGVYRAAGDSAAVAGRRPSPPLPAGGATTLDIGDCISRSWELLKANFGQIVGATALVILLLVTVGLGLRFGINFALGVSYMDMIHTRGIDMFRMQWPGILVNTLWSCLMTGPLMGGLYNFYLKLMRGQSATLADAFAGFGAQFGHLMLGSLCTTVLAVLGLFCCLIPGIYLGVAWRFTFPAIIDKRLGFRAAMKLSRRTVTGRWWPVFALVLLSGLIAAAGLLACCIGVFVTAPIAIGAILYAYEDLLGIQLAAS